jgi:3-hydroxyisobutyrate dehydrogenase-like beta-hydroxyacid dehydrogenase
MKVGLLHPGAMGVSVGASVKAGGHLVYWCSKGRSVDTRKRAQKADLMELTSLRELCDRVGVILSICPPHAAEQVLHDVVDEEFQGIYVDANAISPQKSVRMAELSVGKGITYVDGGIVGGPAWEPNSTYLYLCGEKTESVAGLFTDGPLEVRNLGNQIGQASGLKMCYAAYSKGSTALISMILAGAESMGIYDDLMELWSHDGSQFASDAERRARRVTRKAWRFAGEMKEIADTFADLGLPDGFHRASGEIYARLGHFKGLEDLPDLLEVLQSLHDGRA